MTSKLVQKGLVALGLAIVLTLFSINAFSDDSWIQEVLGLAVTNAPFGKTMYAGELVKLNVPKGKAIKLSLREGSSKAIVALIPMKEGVKSGAKELLKDEPLLLLHTSSEADYFAVKVLTGTAIVDAEVDKLDELTIEDGQKVTIPLVPFRQTVGRFVNLSDYRSTTAYTFFAGSDEISRASEWDRTINLEFKGSHMAKTWKTAADKIVVESVHGKVLVKVGHPFEKLK